MNQVNWIAVSESLPELNQPVLVAACDGVITVAQRTKVGEHALLCNAESIKKGWTWFPPENSIAGRDEGAWLTLDDEDVTHWAELPQPPEK